jgi:hypothetical protein
MTAFMHDVARAALPVAIGLLVCAAAAAAVRWSRFDDAQAQRLARQYLEPLSTWCLVALATHTLALGAAGEASVLSLVLPLALGAAAVLVRTATESAPRPAAAEPVKRGAAAAPAPPPPATRATHAPSAAPAAHPAAPLWADPADDESATRSGLWSRA